MRRIIKLFIISTAMGLCSIVALGQEKTIEVLNHPDESSIIRAVDTREWLVCNNTNGWSVFSMIDEALPTTQQIHLGNVGSSDKIRIYDFEVFNDTVYFCGSVWFGDNQKAVWGYFPLTGFPSVNVRYIIRNMQNLTKLDVFSIDPTMNEIHVVMVGQQAPKHGIMVDEVRTGPGLFVEYTGELSDVVAEDFTDVAVTEKYVVTSLKKYDLELQGGQVLFIRKPTSLHTTVFSNTAQTYTISGKLSIDGLLEHCKNDSVAFAYKGFQGYLNVHTFNGPSPREHLKVVGLHDYALADIKFDRTNEDLDILVRPALELSRPLDTSIILHLNHSLAAYGGPLFCHKYYNETLNSLEWIPWENKRFVASGHDQTSSQLRVYKYQYDYWGICTQQRILQSEKLETKKNNFKDLQYSSCEIELQETSVSEKAMSLSTICE